MLPVVLFTSGFDISFSSSPSNNGSVPHKKHCRSKPCCHLSGPRRYGERYSLWEWKSCSKGQSDFRLGNLFRTCWLQWQIPVSSTNKGLLITSTTIPPGYPLSPAVVRSVVPNVTRAVWDFVATDPPVSGHFRFVFFSLSCYRTSNGLMVFRIRNPSDGEFWGLPTLAENTPIQLGAAGAVDHQIWVLELVVNV